MKNHFILAGMLSGLLALCGCRSHTPRFDRVNVAGIPPFTNMAFKTTVQDPHTIEALLSCFPGWSAPPMEGKPSELPDPYTYFLDFAGQGGKMQINVHGPVPGLYPGLWRHPSGVHYYLEGDKPAEFHAMMNRLREGSQQSDP